MAPNMWRAHSFAWCPSCPYLLTLFDVATNLPWRPAVGMVVGLRSTMRVRFAEVQEEMESDSSREDLLRLVCPLQPNRLCAWSRSCALQFRGKSRNCRSEGRGPRS